MFPKITVLGVQMIRTRVLLGPCWGSLILGNYHIRGFANYGFRVLGFGPSVGGLNFGGRI